MPISDQGITTASGVSFTWDELNNDFTSDKARSEILQLAGIPKDQQQPILNGLRSYEQQKYKAYEKATAKQTTFKDVGDVLGSFKSLPSVIGGFKKAIGKGTGKGKPPSEQDYQKIYEKSPLAGLVKSEAAQEKVAQARGEGTGGTFPAISQQALDQYTKHYVLPAQAQLHKLIQGDMSQWQSAINNIANATGQQGSPVTQLFQNFQQAQSPLYQMLGDATAQAQLTAPYTQMMNRAVGNQANVGARLEALGAMGQNLGLYGLLDPQTAQMLQQSASLAPGLGGGGLGGGTTGIQSILQGLTTAPRPTGAG